ncbi:hypothetical protein BJ322DRAFT_310750 [Thelephora terrestris]|uniref:Uncharacterized protein n=1 Tax=Thelephora terrestris TaxID=56493 RepID=A0A9P6L292_9AGAM|nr:hypothetical protein BJ322DRAFT_310750 [Thelephora terrestris]
MAEVVRLYRHFLREVGKSSLVPRPQRNKALARHYRALFEQPRDGPNAVALSCEFENAVKFLRHQREYKTLLERYNPLIDLTGEERIEATARRVGLNMPEMAKGDAP